MLREVHVPFLHQSLTRAWSGRGDQRTSLRRFRYALDPLCVAAGLLYVLQRWIIDVPALRGWFTDVLLIPAGLPVFLWGGRLIALRSHDKPPTAWEIAFLFVLWSFAAEIIAPALFAHCTADPRDVVCYAVGSLFSLAWWSRKK